MQTYDGFTEKELNYTSPFEIFYDWFEEAKTEEINDPDAMSLATVNDDGQPNVRMVLLKKIDHGFVFFSNKNSQKGIELNKRALSLTTKHSGVFKTNQGKAKDAWKVNTGKGDEDISWLL